MLNSKSRFKAILTRGFLSYSANTNPATCLVSKLRRLHEPSRYGFMSRVSFNVFFSPFSDEGFSKVGCREKTGKLFPTKSDFSTVWISPKHFQVLVLNNSI